LWWWHGRSFQGGNATAEAIEELASFARAKFADHALLDGLDGLVAHAHYVQASRHRVDPRDARKDPGDGDRGVGLWDSDGDSAPGEGRAIVAPRPAAG
jgi:hypothetical protein